MNKEIREGIDHSIPIALGYFPVSFTFGLIATSSGLNPLLAFIISLTNFTSAGQFAGMKVILAGGTYIEMIITIFVINLRYMLMSLSISQKIKGFDLKDRLFTSFGMTDEIFAVSSIEKDEISNKYMQGIITLPYISWGLGTLLGGLISEILPIALKNAMGIALYGMFLAIIIPVAKKDFKVLGVIIIAIAISCAIYYIPIFEIIPDGWAIIISTIIASALGALIFPEVNSDE
ncbi:MAG: AzlC family ABC transporter permease [Andreesenia angusta]|nr:AzlC family ABC transporter permease [Andreesenia angusta]